jgi:hypothetical protein
MSISVRRRVGLVLMAAVVLSVLAVPAASAGTLAGPSESVSGSQLGANNDGGWGCCQYYVVHRGDNLTRIAYRYGTTVNALMSCNNIWNPDRIYVGQRLWICSPSCRPPKPPKPPSPQPRPCPQPCPPQPQPQPCPQPCPQPQPQLCPPPPQPCPQPCPPQPQLGYWLGQYYNNMELSGAPVFQTSSKYMCFDWGWGSPAPQVPGDGWSARFTAPYYMLGGTWRLSATSDDGVRVYVDGVLLLDAWTVQSATTYVRDVSLPTGTHNWVVEYFENDQLARLCVTITKL